METKTTATPGFNCCNVITFLYQFAQKSMNKEHLEYMAKSDGLAEMMLIGLTARVEAIADLWNEAQKSDDFSVVSENITGGVLYDISFTLLCIKAFNEVGARAKDALKQSAK